jgi:hypothetical protein
MKELESKFTTMRSELKGVPKSIESIDWAYWEKQISDKNLLSQIRKDYESLSFPKPKGQDLSNINNKLDAAIKRTGENAEISKAELSRLRQELKAAEEEKSSVNSWNFYDYLARYPGLDEQLRKEWEEGYQLPTTAEERLKETDINQLRTQFKNNQTLNVDLSEVDTKVGSFDSQAEIKKIEQLVRLHLDNTHYLLLQSFKH